MRAPFDHIAETRGDGGEKLGKALLVEAVIADEFFGLDFEIAHQRLDHAGAPFVLGGEGVAARGREMAVADPAGMGTGRGRVLGIALRKVRDRRGAEPDQHLGPVVGVTLEVAPQKADQPRPFRLAIIQLGTYDGTIYNARQVIDKIGHLCDYILFDSAWVGYEQFIPMMADGSPLLLDLDANDPGIFVTQSVHKQQAGFSQTSQIHKKDNHIRGQARFCPHKRLNNAFMLHASTSPFYPLFAALDVNAKIHEGESGRRLWAECVALGIEARKAILTRCKMIQPFIQIGRASCRERVSSPV